MDNLKKQTVKIRRENFGVSDESMNNYKEFNRIKKMILEALSKEDLTIDLLSKKTGFPKDKILFYLLSLVKFGLVETGDIDEMDEYYKYKLKKQ
jgi:predicted Rossmann fold nucleotide-binding protein DprA/Smf involved in DNA uptake